MIDPRGWCDALKFYPRARVTHARRRFNRCGARDVGGAWLGARGAFLGESVASLPEPLILIQEAFSSKRNEAISMGTSSEQAINTDLVTLSRHTLNDQPAAANGDLTLLLMSIQLGCKFVSSQVRRAGIVNL